MRVASLVPALALTALLAGALAPAAPAEAQEPPAASFGESVAVDLMTVEVIAVDSRGQVVHDLTREDFRLFEDGRAVSLTHFESPRGAAALASGSADGSGASTVEPPGHVVVVVDNVHLGVVNRPRLFAMLAEALESSLRPGDEVMVIDYDGSTRVALPFTDSRRALATALETQRDGEARYLTAALDRRRGLEDLQRLAEVERDGGSGCMSLGPMAWDKARQRHSEVLQTIRALGHLVGTLSGVPGRKSLVYVSDGIPTSPGAVEVQYAIDMCDGTALREGIRNARDVTTSEGMQNVYWDPEPSRIDILSLDVSNDWYLLAAQASAQRVVFFPLQSSGLTGLAGSLGGQVRTTGHVESLQRRDPQDTLALLAAETGGTAILHTNDLGAALGGALQDARQSYVLGFTPASGGADRRHALRVEVARPGVELRYPRSYYRKTAHGQMADAVSSSLLHGVEANPLGLQVAFASAQEAGRRSLRVSVPLDKATLLPAGDRAQGLLTVFVATRHEDGPASQVRQKTIRVSVAAGAAGQGEPFVHEIGLTLAPGRHQVAVGVYDEIGGALSYLRREIVVEGDAVRRASGR